MARQARTAQPAGGRARPRAPGSEPLPCLSPPARAKAKALGIKIVSVLYTQGRYDFVDVVEAPSPEAMLNFSVWYASQGFGSFQSMPAFDGKTMAAASKQD